MPVEEKTTSQLNEGTYREKAVKFKNEQNQDY